MFKLKGYTMDLVSWFLIFIFCHLGWFDSAQGQNTSQSRICPDNFMCGSLGNLSFPFTESTKPDCGLCKVDCNATSYPMIEFEGVKYQALGKQDVFIRLKDPLLETNLKNRSCKSFDSNLSLPVSPSITYRVYPFISLFKCITGQKTSEEFSDFQSYNGCESFTLYYKYSFNYFPGFGIPINCSVIQLPMLSGLGSKSNESGLFDMLSAEVQLGWTVSEECNQCYYRGGQCLADNTTNNFLCHTTEGNGNTNVRMIVIIVLAVIIGAVFGICTIGLVLWCYKRRKTGSSYLLPRNTSSGPSMTHEELEEHSHYLGIPVFSYTELLEATNNFQSSRQLGDGGYGTVYHGKLRDGREVAVKRLYENNCKKMQQFITEIEILTRLMHTNLVILYGCTSRLSRELLLVYEYVPNGTVADHLRGHRAKEKLLTWPIRLNIAIDTASALVYLHASDIIHRDVKTNNILLDNDFCVKVADFGLSRFFPTDVTHISTAPQGTPGYVDPQYHECYQLTDKSDVYSFGVVLVELISSKPAVDMSRHMHEINLANFAINRILKCAFDEVIDPSLGFETDSEVRRMITSVAELAFQCLQGVKDMRPTMDEVLETLKTIKESESKYYHIKEINSDSSQPRSVKVCHPIESDDAVLLKKTTLLTSPASVTDTWASSSTTTTTSA